MHLILRRGKNGAYLCAKCGERLLQAFAHFLFPTFPTHCYYCYISNLKILYYKIQKYIITINCCAKWGKWQRPPAATKLNLEINWTSLTHRCHSSKRGSLKTALESALQTAPKSALKIIEQISNNPRVTMTDIANLTGYSRRWVAQTIKRLQEYNIIKRIGSDKSGYWEIIGK